MSKGESAFNQAGINNFNNCVVLAIQLIVLVCFYCRTMAVLGCVVHDRVMFYSDVSTQVTKRQKRFHRT